MNNSNVIRPGFVRSPGRSLLASAELALRSLGLRLIMLICLLWFGVVALRADTHYVSLNGTNDVGHSYSNDWAGAATNIQLAVDKATDAGDTVLVSNGTYNLTNRISIAANITVRSFSEQSHGTNDTIVDGGYPDRTNQCFYMSAGTLDGLTIRNGATTNVAGYWQGGGGIQMGANANVFNCYIYGNRVTNDVIGTYAGGGAIFITLGAGGSIISNCTIVSNAIGGTASAPGGGIKMYGGLIVASRISENWAPSAGGIVMSGGVISNCTVNNNVNNGITTSGGALITDSMISNNQSSGAGGGVHLYGSTMRNSTIVANTTPSTGGGVNMNCFTGNILLSNCLVTANVANNGGGIYMNGASGSGVVANCTIVGNTATNGGGGLYVTANGGYPQLVKNCLIYGNTNKLANGGGVYLNWTGQYPYGLINCTIAGNEAGTLGGGLYTTTYSNYIANCIIYGNVTAGDNHDEVYNNTVGGTNNFWYNCTFTNLVAGQGNTTNNPLFINAANRNYRLGSGSPCINTGTNMNWMTNSIDLEGRVRIRYGKVDMGAYETIYSGTMYGFR